ncbi:MAG TPA: phosphate/phosphite/phosphonate ABC transporter substrate-binding protein [Burkholderiales bacterium]|nr:phosphate/phosphite/phosphonate ABC transporter substrate-binding protein [Burkholderiales bacterium]
MRLLRASAVRHLLAYLAGMVTLFILSAAYGQTARARYTFSVVPVQLPLATHKDWSPVVEHLSKRLNADIDLRVHRSFADYEAEVTQGIPDFSVMGPYHIVIGHRRQGYIPLVRSSQMLTGILVVPRDSPMKTVKDLNGKVLAFPSPNSLAASLYIRALLTERERVKFTPRYLDSHNDVYRHVMLHQVDGGGGIQLTLSQQPSDVQAKLRILYETPPMVPHPLSAHPRVPATVRAAVTQAILDLAKTEEGKTTLARLQISQPQIADYQRDYRPLEQLHLDKYVVTTQ